MLPTGEDRLSGDVPSHLAQPCYVALGQALIWGLYPDWFEGFVNWVPLPKVGTRCGPWRGIICLWIVNNNSYGTMPQTGIDPSAASDNYV